MLENFFEDLKFDLKTVIFGYNSETEKYISGINTFIMLIKTYLFSCKTKNQQISNEAAIYYLKYNCNIHKMVSKDANRQWIFFDRWLPRQNNS